MKAIAFVLAIFILFCVCDLARSDSLQIGKPLSTPAVQSPRDAGADIVSYQLDGLSGIRIKQALSASYGDRASFTSRGRHDAELYRRASPSVVMIVTAKSIGSGVYIGGNEIVTNWHVIATYNTVGIIFKPAIEGTMPAASSLVRADVIKFDTNKDLALLKVASLPKNVQSLEMGSDQDIQIGADVHAIGHPTGEAWTYTKGLISQIRKHYTWKAENRTHTANVIQTQTPINPGNSGGPLIADNGKLVGINSFRATNAEGLNFAVSVEEVRDFLRLQSSSSAPVADNKCKATELFHGRNAKNDGEIITFDTNCDGRVDFQISAPDDTRKPIEAEIDSNFDGKADIIVDDNDRDGRWDISFHDVDYDGVIDLVGYHPDGKLKPSRFERYIARK